MDSDVNTRKSICTDTDWSLNAARKVKANEANVQGLAREVHVKIYT